MMKKIKFLMLLALISSIFSCRTETLPDESSDTQHLKISHLRSKKISLDQSSHKVKLLTELNDAKADLKKLPQNIFGKTIDYPDGVIIDTEHITYIENGPNYHTYTFNILNEGSSMVQNLVLTPLLDGTYKKLIFTYNFTDAERLDILKGIPINTKGKTFITELSDTAYLKMGGSCAYEVETIWNDCSEGVHNSSNVGTWWQCTADTPPSAYTIGFWNCSGAGGSGSSGSGTGNPNPGGGGNNNGSGSGSGMGCEADSFENPTDPMNSPGPCSGGVPTQPTLSTSFSWFLYYLPNNLGSIISNNQISDFYQGFKTYYEANVNDPLAMDFIIWGLQFKKDNPNISWEEFWNNKHLTEPNSSMDSNNNESGNYDETLFEDFNFENQQTQWPTINNVISTSDFVGWGANGIRRNCMDYAKAQIAKKGYKVSNYYDVDSQGNKQTFQIYSEQNGVNLNNLYKGISYLKYALTNGIPVIVGIDDKSGHPGNLDQSTDYFVVIVGMGTDSKGRYFRFYDNASGDPSQGANPENKLYIKYPQRIFTGITQCIVYRGETEYDYIMTMIRKSK